MSSASARNGPVNTGSSTAKSARALTPGSSPDDPHPLSRQRERLHGDVARLRGALVQRFLQVLLIRPEFGEALPDGSQILHHRLADVLLERGVSRRIGVLAFDDPGF